jgi:hypothetical protein
MLYSDSAPTITAVVPEPGTPSVSIGTKLPSAEALLAASGAATPRMSPLPNGAFGVGQALFHRVGHRAGDGGAGTGQHADDEAQTAERTCPTRSWPSPSG